MERRRKSHPHEEMDHIININLLWCWSHHLQHPHHHHQHPPIHDEWLHNTDLQATRPPPPLRFWLLFLPSAHPVYLSSPPRPLLAVLPPPPPPPPPPLLNPACRQAPLLFMPLHYPNLPLILIPIIHHDPSPVTIPQQHLFIHLTLTLYRVQPHQHPTPQTQAQARDRPRPLALARTAVLSHPQCCILSQAVTVQGLGDNHDPHLSRLVQACPFPLGAMSYAG